VGGKGRGAERKEENPRIKARTIIDYAPALERREKKGLKSFHDRKEKRREKACPVIFGEKELVTYSVEWKKERLDGRRSEKGNANDLAVVEGNGLSSRKKVYLLHLQQKKSAEKRLLNEISITKKKLRRRSRKKPSCVL